MGEKYVQLRYRTRVIDNHAMGSPVLTLSDVLSCQHVYAFTPLLSACLRLFEVLDPIETFVILMKERWSSFQL